MTSSPPGTRREILRLAVPAFLTLVAEPLFLLTDAAIVGHLGTAELAGLGVASAVLLTAANLFVFLAYGTTATVARQLGAGRQDRALQAGIAGVWLALALGVVVGTGVAVFAADLIGLFGATPAAAEQGTIYLRISALGLPAMLVALAATGVLRGLQDTRTPLVVSLVGFSTNVVLNLVLVYGVGLGIAGSALGTVLAQLAMALALTATLLRQARRAGARLDPQVGPVLGAARTGVPLLVRTLALRTVLLLTTAVAAGWGDVPLAAHQVSMTLWSFLVFALDALAIAAQALTGKGLGAGDAGAVRTATRTMVRWGVGGGAVLGLGLLAVSQVLPGLFSPDPAVQQAIAAALVVIALGQPLAGFVFVLDGVLIGAGDGRWLAGAMVLNLLAYLPILGLVRGLGGSDATTDVVLLWAAFTGFMVVRAGLLGHRARGDRWMVLGAE